MKNVLFIFGTRPEAIKLAPLIKEMKKEAKYFNVHVCVTGQHREMLDQALSFFGIEPDFDLKVMIRGQSLSDLTAKILKKLNLVLDKTLPDLVVVQGDTTSAFVGALAAFYKKIKVVHIEAGLRTGDKLSPFPEEANRLMVSQLADYHFAPTKSAQNCLSKESIKNNVFIVGNTVVDTLFLVLNIIRNNNSGKEYSEDFKYLDFSKKIILVTGHRRESFGKPLENICRALVDIAKNQDVQIVYPVHLNPNVKEPVHKILGSIKNIHLIQPLDYPSIVWLMNKSYLVITDSGGIQEEAPSFRKPVLVTREMTERIEGIKSGTALLVGSDQAKIVKTVRKLLNGGKKYRSMTAKKNPYGDGKSCARIIKILKFV